MVKSILFLKSKLLMRCVENLNIISKKKTIWTMKSMKTQRNHQNQKVNILVEYENTLNFTLPSEFRSQVKTIIISKKVFCFLLRVIMIFSILTNKIDDCYFYFPRKRSSFRSWSKWSPRQSRRDVGSSNNKQFLQNKRRKKFKLLPRRRHIFLI